MEITTAQRQRVKVGDIVTYKTTHYLSRDNEIFPQTKKGKIEEVFFTLDKRLCFWIENEKELILLSQIIF